MPIFGLISIIFNNSTHPRSPMDVANARNINKHLKLTQQISASQRSMYVNACSLSCTD